MVSPALRSGGWVGVALLGCVMPVTSKQQGGAEEEEGEGWPVFKTTQQHKSGIRAPVPLGWCLHAVEGWEQLPQLLSSEVELEHEAEQSQKELWNISEPRILPLSAACGFLVLFLGTGRCCGPAGMLSQWVICLNKCPQGCEQGGFGVQRF